MKKGFWNRLFLVLAIIASLGVPVKVLISDRMQISYVANNIFIECREKLSPESYTPDTREWNECEHRLESYSAFDTTAIAKKFFLGVLVMSIGSLLLYLVLRGIVWTIRWIGKGSE
ncbi:MULTISPECIES: hypothetical protein [Pantoea]|jgi:hypothetical protein|uniref:hypothetical protein n=1 Tax=Pantoea TaxID=53335 RepID=UPI002579AB94|nr:hypothetical protein [Pantoea sp. UBA5960]